METYFPMNTECLFGRHEAVVISVDGDEREIKYFDHGEGEWRFADVTIQDLRPLIRTKIGTVTEVTGERTGIVALTPVPTLSHAEDLASEVERLTARVAELEGAIAQITVQNEWTLSKDQKFSDLLKEYVAAYEQRALLTLFRIRGNMIETLSAKAKEK